MSYVGNIPSQTSFVYDTFSGTGAQTTFQLQVAPGSSNNCLVTIGVGNGATVAPPTSYSVTGTDLVFANAPAAGTNNVIVRYLGLASTTAGLTRLSGGITGLTPTALTSGDVTLAGVLIVANGGTGNPTGIAANVSGIVAVVNGGTGISNSGSSGNVLTSNGSIWQSSPIPTPSTLSSGTGANQWSVSFSGTKMYFAYNGVNVVSIDSSGNILTLGNVTAAATSV
jgi:hypothetical protein